MRARITRAVSIAWLVACAPLGAARATTNQAMAQALFDEGKRLMAEGDYAQACPKLAESQRLDPSGGTLLHLGICHGHEGKTATAYAELNEAISVARRDGRADREAAAREHLAGVTEALVKVTITVTEDVKVAGLEVTLDGTPVREAQWGTPLPLDPGEHVVAAAAPKRQTWTVGFAVAPRAPLREVTIPMLERVSEPQEPAQLDVARKDVAPPSDTRDSSRRVLGLGIAGGGLVAVAVAGVFQLRTYSLASERDDAAAMGDRVGRDEKHADAKSSQLVAMIAGGAGAVGVAAGLWLFLTAPRVDAAGRASVHVAPLGGRGVGGMVVGGSF